MSGRGPLRVSWPDRAARELTFTRVLRAPRHNVWRCWTEPALIVRWFTPPPWQTVAAEMDVRPGVYLEVVPDEKLVFTDAFVRGWEPSNKAFMTGELRFADLGRDTRYTVRVGHWSVADRDAHEQMGFHQGWGIATDQLEALAASL